MKPTHRMQILPISLVATLLACAAPAQSTAASTPSATSPSNQTARGLLERAAFEEGNQRDFAAAEKSYAEAEAAARAANDAKTAEAAAAGRARVLARQGKAPAAKAEIDENLRAMTRASALNVLFRAQGELPSPENVARAAQDLADLGPSVIGVLADSLRSSHSVDPSSGIPRLPEVAARALARMSSDEADAVLIKAYDSPDPLVRRAMVYAASGPQFLEVFLRASVDEVASIRAHAANRLLQSSDPRAAPAIETLARENMSAATDWLCNHAPERVLAMVEDESVSGVTRSDATNRLQNVLKIDAKVARRLVVVAQASASSNDELSSQAWYLAARIDRNPDVPRDAEFERLERTLVEASRSTRRTTALYILGKLNSPHTLGALRSLVRTWRENPSAVQLRSLENVLPYVFPTRTDAGSFEEWMGLVTEIPTSWVTTDGRSAPWSPAAAVASGVLSSKERVTLARALAAWSNVPESHRDVYTDALTSRLDAELKDNAVPTLDATADAPLRFMLRSDSPNWVYIAVLAVERCERIELASELIVAAKVASNDAVRALYSLAVRRPSEVRSVVAAAVRALYSDADPKKRTTASTDWFRTLPPDQGLSLWKELWAEKPPLEGRQTLLKSLVQSQFPLERLDLLVELYPTIERELGDYRGVVIYHFGSALVEASLPILERELRSPDPDVRAAAVKASTQFRTQREAIAEFEAWRKATTAEQETVAELSKLLESQNRDVVLGAVKALGILRARPALPSLVKLLARDDASLRTAVQAAIDLIGAP